MKTVLCILVFVGLVSIGSALECYKCNSHEDNDCINLQAHTMAGYLKECNQGNDKTNYTLCRKMHMFLDQNFGEANPAEDRVHRDCGTIPDGDIKMRGDCYYKSGYNTRTWVCSCNEDACNAAPAMLKLAGNVAITALVGPAVAALYLRNGAWF